ncbi:MAG: hypothetical protein AAFN09_00125 [Pseudomonadota bacterium]
MSEPDPDPCCGRPVEDKDSLRAEAGLDTAEHGILDIARFYFSSFAHPDSQAWMAGLDTAQALFGDDGPRIAARVMDVLRAMRCARRSTFMFNAPTCPGCSRILTEHERRLIQGFAALRRGAMGQARVEAMMLCEGNPTGALLDAMQALADVLPGTQAPQYARPPTQSERTGYAAIPR